MPEKSRGTSAALIAPIALVALAALLLATGTGLVIPAVLVALAMGCGLVLLARWRPERVALLLAVVIVVLGAGAAGVHVADGIADARVDYYGDVDAKEIIRNFHPSGADDPLASLKREGYGYLSSAEGEATKSQVGSGVLALWSVQQLAPWLLAAIVLILLLPILRAAGRGEPFWEGATRRLTASGVLLLLGIPAIELLRFLVAQAASTGASAAPLVEPSLTISISHILPGVLVLALASIFRRGVELRDLERHTI